MENLGSRWKPIAKRTAADTAEDSTLQLKLCSYRESKAGRECCKPPFNPKNQSLDCSMAYNIRIPLCSTRSFTTSAVASNSQAAADTSLISLPPLQESKTIRSAKKYLYHESENLSGYAYAVRCFKLGVVKLSIKRVERFKPQDFH